MRAAPAGEVVGAEGSGPGAMGAGGVARWATDEQPTRAPARMRTTSRTLTNEPSRRRARRRGTRPCRWGDIDELQLGIVLRVVVDLARLSTVLADGIDVPAGVGVNIVCRRPRPVRVVHAGFEHGHLVRVSQVGSGCLELRLVNGYLAVKVALALRPPPLAPDVLVVERLVEGLVMLVVVGRLSGDVAAHDDRQILLC